MAKRRCLPRVSKHCDRSNIDALLESLIDVSDSALIDDSIDGLVDCRATDSDQYSFIQRAVHLGSVLVEAGKRYARKRFSIDNALVWPLSQDLTIKVFSMLDTPNVCSAAATCSFFQKCASDPFCYANIDLLTLVPKVNDDVVSTIIQRAGSSLQSIKVGMLLVNRFTQRNESSPLTSACLGSLSTNCGASGSLYLKRLHLHKITKMDNIELLASLSMCPSLVDLEIVASDVLYTCNSSSWNVEVSPTLESVSRHCRLIERFIFESDGNDDFVKTPAVEEFVLSCPKITTLAIRNCVLEDDDAHKLVKGFRELKYVDFSYSANFDGSFLKNLGTKRRGGNNLEIMYLRQCYDLDQVELKKFMKALLAGKFSLLTHLDISNSEGLAYKGDFENRRDDVSFIPRKQLLKQRPNLCLVADFSRYCFMNTFGNQDLGCW